MVTESWPNQIRGVVPGIDVVYYQTIDEAKEAIIDPDAAYGDIVPKLFKHAEKVKWIQSPQVGPKAGYYH